MKILAIIPLRKDSQRIKNKNILRIKNKPMFRHASDEAVKCKYISKVFIATDIDKIKLPTSSKIQVFKRSKKSTSKKAPTELVIKEFLTKYDCDYCILIQATNLFLTKNDLDSAIKKILNKKNTYDSLLSVVESKYLIWKRIKNKNVSYNYDYRKRPRSQDIKSKEYIENGSFYIFSRKNFLKYENRLHGNIGLHVMKKNSIFEIDEKEDLEIVKRLY